MLPLGGGGRDRVVGRLNRACCLFNQNILKMEPMNCNKAFPDFHFLEERRGKDNPVNYLFGSIPVWFIFHLILLSSKSFRFVPMFIDSWRTMLFA